MVRESVKRQSESITARKEHRQSKLSFKGIQAFATKADHDQDQPAGDHPGGDQFVDDDYDDDYDYDVDDYDDYGSVYNILDKPIDRNRESQIIRCRPSQMDAHESLSAAEAETLMQSKSDESPPTHPSYDHSNISDASTDEYYLYADTSQILSSDTALNKKRLSELRFEIPSISNIKQISELYRKGKEKRRQSTKIRSRSFQLFSSSDSYSELDTIQEDVKDQNVDDASDRGVFVNPTTGVILSDSSEPKQLSYTTEDWGIAEEGLEDSYKSNTTFSVSLTGIDYSNDSKSSSDQKETIVIDEFQQIKTMMEGIRCGEESESDESASFLEEVFNFLTNLMDSVVDKVEEKYTKFDKMKLWKTMTELVATYEDLQEKNSSLTSQMIEHFRLAKNKRAITPLKKDVEVIAKAKYKDQLQILDELLETEKQIKEKCMNLSKKTKKDFNKIEFEVKQREAELDEHIRKTLLKSNNRDLKQIVDECLEKISLKRVKISEVRLSTIFRQHTVAMLKAKLKSCETVSDDLRLTAYMNTQSKMQSLEKKFQERKFEEEHYRSLCNSNEHIIAHLKEKQEILIKMLESKRKNLEEIKSQANILHDRILAGKIKNSKILREIQNLTRKGGLLTKPNLMFDYDTTLEKVNVLQMVVKELRKRLADIINVK